MSSQMLYLTWIGSKKVSSIGKPALGGPWTLVENQRPVTDASFHGNYALLYFGFTRCPDICPNELVRLGKVIDTLGKEE
jgi:protein SCO1/2